MRTLTRSLSLIPEYMGSVASFVIRVVKKREAIQTGSIPRQGDLASTFMEAQFVRTGIWQTQQAAFA